MSAFFQHLEVDQKHGRKNVCKAVISILLCVHTDTKKQLQLSIDPDASSNQRILL